MSHSAASSSSNSDYFSQMINLDSELQLEQIALAPPDKIVELFAKALDSYDSSNQAKIDQISLMSINRILRLIESKGFIPDQIKLISDICVKNFPQIVNPELANTIQLLLKTTIDQHNVEDFLKLALINDSKELLENCLNYFTKNYNIITRRTSDGKIELFTNPELLNKNFDVTNTLLSTLKKYCDPNLIDINFTEVNEKNHQNALIFIKEHHSLIRKMSVKGLVDEPQNSVKPFSLIIHDCSNLISLVIDNCDISSEDLSHLHQLQNLNLSNCQNLIKALDLEPLKQLRSLKIDSCHKLEESPKLSQDVDLLKFEIGHCINLERISYLDHASSLESILINSCPKLKIIGDVSSLKSLISLNIYGGHEIKDDDMVIAINFMIKANPYNAIKMMMSSKTIKGHSFERELCESNPNVYFYHIDEFSPIDIKYRKELLHKLIYTDPKSAEKLIFKIPMEAFSTIEDKQVIFDFIENYCMKDNPNLGLRLAVDFNRIDLIEKAIAANADVNSKLILSTPLLRACKYGTTEMIHLLLDHGANTRFIGGTHHHETPLSEARLRADLLVGCLERLNQLDDGFTDEVILLKLLWHKFSIFSSNVKVDNVEFFGLGFRPQKVVQDYEEQNEFFYNELIREVIEGKGSILDQFSDDSKNLILSLRQDPSLLYEFNNIIKLVYDSVVHSLDNEGIDLYANEELLKNKFLQQLDEGKPVVLYGVTNTVTKSDAGGAGLHAWGLVITKDPTTGSYFVHRCNRGYHASKRGILVGQFGVEEMLEILNQYQKLSKWKNNSSKESDDFFGELDQKINQNLKQVISQKAQKVGNCCYYSLQSIELALLKELLKPIVGEFNGIHLAREIKRVRTLQMKKKDLEEYLTSHLPGQSKYPVDWKFLGVLYDKLGEKKKFNSYRSLIVSFIHRVIKENPDIITELPFNLKSLANLGEKRLETYINYLSVSTKREQVRVLNELWNQNFDLLKELIELGFIKISFDVLKMLDFKDRASDLPFIFSSITYQAPLALKFCKENEITHFEFNYFRDFFSNFYQEMNETSIKNQFSFLTSIDFSNCPEASCELVGMIAKTCPHLTTLNLTNCCYINHDFIENLIHNYPQIKIIF